MISLIVSILLIFSTVVSATPCKGLNATTFLRSEGLRLMEFAARSIKDVTLNACAEACTSDAKGELCSSFEYDARTQECSLHPEDGQPFGPSVLAKSQPPIAYFQHICIQEDKLCSTPYAFERYPQSILVGQAMHVLTTDGLSDCLSACLSPNQHAVCRSLMYYYETGECIMNRETKKDLPAMFKEGIQETLVDYFENNCYDVECSATSLHWIRTEEFIISHEKDVIIESMTRDECKAVCMSNRIGPERFPCKAFVYSEGKRECHLSAESGYAGRRAASFDLNPISSGEYFEKYCLDATVQCIDASFEQVPNRRMATDSYMTIDTGNVNECLAICLDDGSKCVSVVYDYETDECHLSSTSQFTNPDSFANAVNSDYYDKICEPVPGSQTAAPGARSAAQAAKSLSIEKKKDKQLETDELATNEISSNEDSDSNTVIERTDAETEGTVVDDVEELDITESEQKMPTVKAHMSTECRMSGVSVSVTFANLTSGAIYIKDHFATCKVEFTNSSQAVLHIPFPHSDDDRPRCPGVELAPSQWAFSVVVQKNEMSSPSLVTSTDRVFNITCDYTQLVERAASSQFKIGASKETTQEPIDELELRSKKISMQILRDGKAVTTVPLGEEVTLQWTIIDSSNDYGFFVSECVAERVGGLSPEPEPLKIIHQGCPDAKVKGRLLSNPISRSDTHFSTKMKVFRFDGSRRVRIKCSIDVCVHRCPSVICDGLDTQDQESFGRKKRQSMEELAGLLKKLKPNFSVTQTTPASLSETSRTIRHPTTVSGTLTITDRQKTKKIVKPRPEFTSMNPAEMCLMRSHVVAAVIIFSVLSVVQLFVLLNYLHRRFSRPPDDLSCSSSTTGYTASSLHYDFTSVKEKEFVPQRPRHQAPSPLSSPKYEVPFQSFR